jgi:hypothetical protein
MLLFRESAVKIFFACTDLWELTPQAAARKFFSPAKKFSSRSGDKFWQLRRIFPQGGGT